MFKAACKLGLEGIVSKKLNAPYRSGPSRTWIKVKNPKAIEAGYNLLAVHKSDPVVHQLQLPDMPAQSAACHSFAARATSRIGA
jgi:hypothetical protein